MKNGKFLILLTTVALLLLAAGIGLMEPAPQLPMEVNIPLSVTILMDGHQEQIACWEDSAGEYVVFLPSGMNLSEAVLSVDEQTPVLLDSEPLAGAVSCSRFQLDTPYPLICTVNGVREEHVLRFQQSAQVPSVHLDVRSGSMDLIHETKGNEEPGELRLYSETGELAYSGMIESLRGRGNSSWFQEKKPYSMTLAREADLLGMGRAENWILLANASDPSHLRNKLVYDLAARTGMAYAPESRWVDLYLNGEYAGLYLLSERNEIHPERLDLPEAGSFLVSRESAWRLISQNYPHVILDSGAALRIRGSGLTETDLSEIWQEAENAILSEDGRDPRSGKHWTELIDLDSWALDYLMGEIFGDVDAGTISQYFYRDGTDPSGKIYAGPVWDYDLSMGSKGTWQTQTVQAFFGDKAHIWSLEDSTWFYGLNRKPEFHARVCELYKEVYRPLLRELLGTKIQEYALQIERSAQLDQRRWGTKSAGEETSELCKYLGERLRFLNRVWVEEKEYCKVLVILDENSSSICHAVLPGETVPQLPAYESTWDILGWYDAATEQPFDVSQPIYQDTTVYLKRLPGEEDRISPLQAGPIAVVLAALCGLILADGRRCRFRKGKPEKQIAKQQIV